MTDDKVRQWAKTAELAHMNTTSVLAALKRFAKIARADARADCMGIAEDVGNRAVSVEEAAIARIIAKAIQAGGTE